ncbi:hypothetical protein CRI65_01705 [Escherichia sp. E3659]|nr:hypothetical protein CRI65_01705 [Escherichia sp. E3659]
MFRTSIFFNIGDLFVFFLLFLMQSGDIKDRTIVHIHIIIIDIIMQVRMSLIQLEGSIILGQSMERI